MTEQEVRIEKLEKEIEILKKRVNYIYEEIIPDIMKAHKCMHKYMIADEKGLAHACYENQGCLSCEYK